VGDFVGHWRARPVYYAFVSPVSAASVASKTKTANIFYSLSEQHKLSLCKIAKMSSWWFQIHTAFGSRACSYFAQHIRTHSCAGALLVSPTVRMRWSSACRIAAMKVVCSLFSPLYCLLRHQTHFFAKSGGINWLLCSVIENMSCTTFNWGSTTFKCNRLHNILHRKFMEYVFILNTLLAIKDI